MGQVRSLRRRRSCVHERRNGTSSTHRSAFWLKPVSIFGLFTLTTFIKRSHTLTIPFTLAPCLL
jgi:hypothetical protein